MLPQPDVRCVESSDGDRRPGVDGRADDMIKERDEHYNGSAAGRTAARSDVFSDGFSGRASNTAPTVTAPNASTRRPPSTPAS